MTIYVKSPLNYTGGKYKILDHIIPIFPRNIDKFVDLFAGGLNVGINVKANIIFANDNIPYLIDIFKYLRTTACSSVIKDIEQRIYNYQLSLTNVEGYNDLRNEYNRSKKTIDLLVLTFYSFNHQLRFNSKHEFNTPFGKDRSSYNSSIERNLINFCSALQGKNIVFSTKDFTEFNFSTLCQNDFVYCDPPYLISTGSYNDGKRGFKDWTLTEEQQLLAVLDSLNSQHIKFALSNVFYHKGLTNNLLIEWSKKYNVKYIDKTYSNCSYHFNDRNTKTVEVLIYNFTEESPCQMKVDL